MKKGVIRLVAGTLTFVMLVSSIPVTAFGEEEQTVPDIIVQEEPAPAEEAAPEEAAPAGEEKPVEEAVPAGEEKPAEEEKPTEAAPAGEEKPVEETVSAGEEKPAEGEKPTEAEPAGEEKLVEEATTAGEEKPAEEATPAGDKTASSDESEQKSAEEPAKETVQDQAKQEDTPAKEDDEEDETDYPAFEPETVEISDSVKINVSAPEGAFPEGAVLSVNGISDEKQEQTNAAIEKIRDENRSVAKSYSFDIKVLDEDGENELEPEDDKKVRIIFDLPEVADENLETKVYHIKEDEETGELSAEELEILPEEVVSEETDPVEATDPEEKTEEDSLYEENAEDGIKVEHIEAESDEESEEDEVNTVVAVETDGFSFYTVEFTYKKTEYLLGSLPVPVSEILSEADLTGEVSAVEVSNDALFSASDETGEWIITPHETFESDEWIKITISEVVYEIAVIDTSAYPAFEPDATQIDKVKISVSAPEGVFPEGAVLSVKKISEEEQKKADTAIQEIRDEKVNVATSYTYDIKVFAADGETELEPKDAAKVKVSFSLAEASDPNLDTQVYHVSENEDTGELSAEALDIIEGPGLSENTENAENKEPESQGIIVEGLDGRTISTGKTSDTVTVETDSFSYYTVEFTYGSLEYVLEGDTAAPMNVILNAIGLTGEVTAVQVSDSSLFTAYEEAGVWIVKALQAFDTTEWMKVTIDGLEYEITVTDDNSETVSSWRELQDKITNSNCGEIILGDNISCPSGEDRIKVTRNVTIDLNGKTLDRNLSKSHTNGQVIEVKSGKLTIKDSSDDKSGEITGGHGEHGGGIYVNEGAILDFKGGTIKKNKAKLDGGGIWVGGTLETDGGVIKENQSDETGGGIFVHKTGTMHLKKTTITGNESNRGGGLNIHGTSTIRNCEITENIAHRSGGGIRLDEEEKRLTITETIIDKNHAEIGDGGGIMLETGSIEMTGGRLGADHDAASTVSGNTSGDYTKRDGDGGGGIAIEKNTSFTATSVKICGNSANYGDGGGIYVMEGGMAMLTDCTVKHNHAPYNDTGGILNQAYLQINNGITVSDNDGYGIFIGKHATNTVIGGKVIVKDNGDVEGSEGTRKKGIYLREDKLLGFMGGSPLTNDSDIYVTKDGTGKIPFTRLYNVDHHSEEPSAVFHSPDGYIIVKNEIGEACLYSPWATLSEKLSSATGTVKLGEGEYAFLADLANKECIAGAKDERLDIKTTFTLDLNGYTLNRNLKERGSSGHVIEIEDGANLTIKDSAGGGKITGGYSYYGGGIYVSKGATLTLDGGTITGNKAHGHGGGIYVNHGGTLNFNSGIVDKNQAGDKGGGIYSKGVIDWQNGVTHSGKITNNNASGDGGGIYLANDNADGKDSKIKLDNATITGNTSGGKGGGLCLHPKADSSLNDCKIGDNRDGYRNQSNDEGGGIYMNADKDSIKLTISKSTADTYIKGNKSSDAGGGIYLYHGTIDMNNCYGGEISYNTASDAGGGIVVTGKTVFEATSIKINNNTAGDEGGGISAHGKTTLHCCTINNNETDGDGGGIYFTAAHTPLTLDGNNTAGLTITGNKAVKGRGGGIFIDKNAHETDIIGKINATGNTAADGPDLYLAKDQLKSNSVLGDVSQKLTLTGRIDGTKIGSIDMEKMGTFTDKYAHFYQSDIDDAASVQEYNNDKIIPMFSAASGAFEAGLSSDKEVELQSQWAELQAAIQNAAQSAGEHKVTLTKDYRAGSNDGPLHVDANWDVTIDLAGFTINRSLSESKHQGYVIIVNDGGKLTIKDSSKGDEYPTGKGSITGGNTTSSGGGIYVDGVENDTKLTLESGNITGNCSDKDGGGVYVNKKGRFDLNGGSVSGNKAGSDGGGICADGMLFSSSNQVNGGIVDGNSADDTGGGIYVSDSGGLMLDNATISNNTSKEKGGGMNVHLGDPPNGKDWYINNCKILDNKSDDYGGGICINKEDSKLVITNTEINSNVGWEGGGIYLRKGSVDMTGGNISGNGATKGGGGIKLKDTNVTFTGTNVDIYRNLATDESGGGIKNLGTVTLTNCKVHGNAANMQGGGIYNNHSLTINNCEINDNSSESEGGGIYSNKELIIKSAKIHANVAHNMGGGIYVDDNDHSVIQIEGAIMVDDNTASVFGSNVYLTSGKKIELTDKLTKNNDGQYDKIGVDLKSGTGVFTDHYKTYQTEDWNPEDHFVVTKGYAIHWDDGELKIASGWDSIKSEIEAAANNSTYLLGEDCAASSGNDRIVIDDGKHVTVDLQGHMLNRNRSSNIRNGHVFEVKNGSTLTIIDSVGGGMIMGGHSDQGGGIYVHDGCTLNLGGSVNDHESKDFYITGNRSEDYGGGVYVHGTLNMMKGAIICDNTTAGSGGGIYLDNSDKAHLNLKGGVIRDNRSEGHGGGIMVKSDTVISVQGDPVVKSNVAEAGGSDIYLVEDKEITVSGQLSDNAKLLVSIEKSIENGMVEFTDGFDRYNSDKDPAIYFASTDGYSVYKWENEAAFGVDNFGETDYEIPFIDHMNQVKTDRDLVGNQNWMAGISGERYLHEINMPGSHDAGMKSVFFCYYDYTCKLGLARLFQGLTHKWAKTQNERIDQQLEEGCRQLDLRLNDQKKVETSWKHWEWDNSDENNLWIGHGADIKYANYPAKDDEGHYLTFNQVLDWVTEFLKNHPSETIILNLRDETTADGHKEIIANRAKKILQTPEYYDFLYREPGSDDPFAPYSHMPQLKDCRGKIVILVQDNDFLGIVGGFKRAGNKTIDGTDIDFTDPTHYSNTGDEQVVALRNAYRDLNATYNNPYIPQNAEDHMNILWYLEFNCTGEDNQTKTYGGLNYPTDYAKKVNPRLIGENQIINEGQAGKYFGWIRLDDFQAKYAEPIWRTNYFDQEYCTITVKSGLSGNDGKNYPDQEFKLLKGSTFTIPGNIYKQLPKGRYLDYWVDDSGDTGEEWHHNTTYTVERDVVFTGVWSKDGKIPLSIEWDDCDDADRLRGTSVDLNVDPAISGSSTITMNAADHWTCKVPGDIEINSIAPADTWPSKREYTCDPIKHESGTGYVLKLTHTPEATYEIEGKVEWEDEKDSAGKRPDSVTIQLLADGEPYGDPKTVEAGNDGKWKFDFIELPHFNTDKKRINYTIAESPVDGYSTTIEDFTVVNKYLGGSHVTDTVSVGGMVEWEDSGNRLRKRPEEIYVELLANGTEVDKPLEVRENKAMGLWRFDFGKLPVKDDSGESIRYTLNLEDGTALQNYTCVITPIAGFPEPVIQASRSYYFNVKFKLNVDPEDKKDAEVSEEPSARKLTYNGNGQELVNEGVCSGGTLMYAVGDTMPRKDSNFWSENLPEKTEAGDYKVWYYVKGDVLHNDWYPEGNETETPVAAEIDKRPVTFRGLSLTKKYTGSELEVDEFTEEGLLKGHTDNVEYEAKGTEIGQYEGTFTPTNEIRIRSGGTNVTSNYEINTQKGKLTIVDNPDEKIAKWLDGDGSVLLVKTYPIDGQIPAYDGKTPTKAATEKYTYKFNGWDKGTTLGSVTTFKPLFIEIEKKTKGILTLNIGDGKYTTVPAGYKYDAAKHTISIEAIVGTTIKMPAGPELTGYTFDYWEGSMYRAGDDYEVKGDHNFTARWIKVTPDECVVTFNVNGHGQAPASQKIEKGQKATKPSDPAAEGYTFGGWYTDSDCTKAYDFATAVTSDLTLYAKWTAVINPDDPSKGGSGDDSSGGSSSGSNSSGGGGSQAGSQSGIEVIGLQNTSNIGSKTPATGDTGGSGKGKGSKFLGPDTGDNGYALLWLIGFVISTSVLVSAVVTYRKRRNTR